MAILKDGKTENLTIRVDPDLKERAEAIRQKYFNRIPMNIFLEMMIEVGMDVEEQLGALKKELISELAKNRTDLSISGQANSKKAT
ncbi:MAG: hypothetical protein LBT14_02835, partial [Treponema sp.]|jgi:hypothetical protein|nr:hypothetical protein [Treponema sp.]